jgi:hypothetical protein
MDRWYDFHSWSQMYREGALREARMRHLARQAKGNHPPRFRLGHLGSILLSGALPLLKWRPLGSKGR